MVLHSEVMFMEAIDTIRARLGSAPSLPATLAAIWDAFELTRAVTTAYAEDASPRFAMFLYAAAAAHQARDAIYTAPSAPADLADLPDVIDPGELTEDEACRLLAELASLASRRLHTAADEAADPRDRDACREAAEASDELRGILAGAE
jgi:hypothetical protein